MMEERRPAPQYPPQFAKKKKNMFSTKRLLVGFGVVIALVIILAIVINTTDLNWKMVGKYLLIFLGIGLAIFLIVFLVKKFGNKKNKDDTIKQYVHAEDAIKLFSSQFKKEFMPYIWRYDHKKKTKKIFVPQGSFEINKRTPFDRELTGNNFALFEVKSYYGNKKGVHTVILRLDKGEEFMLKNYRLIENVTMMQYYNSFISKNYKLDSIPGENLRTKTWLDERRLEGLEEREISKLKRDFIVSEAQTRDTEFQKDMLKDVLDTKVELAKAGVTKL